MKKIILFVTIVFASITIASAGNGKNISSAISKQLIVPATLKNTKLDEKVNVQFKLTSDGKAIVVDVKTSNPDLKNYIITQFPKIDFKQEKGQEGMYFIDINFKVL